MFDTLEEIDKFFVDNFTRAVMVVEEVDYPQAVHIANLELNALFKGNINWIEYNSFYHDCLKRVITTA